MKALIPLVILALPGSAFSSTDMSSDAVTFDNTGTAKNQSSQVYDQLITLSGGPFSPRMVSVSNGSNTFDYGQGATQSFLVEAGWAMRLFSSFYLGESLAYSRFSGTSQAAATSSSANDKLSMNLVGFDTRIGYSLETLPVGWLIPFVEGGYQYMFFSQTGSSDLESVQGGSGDWVAGAGIRFWINRSSALSTDLKGTYRNLPIFFSVKWNRIFPSGGQVDLSDSGVQAAVSVGL